MKLSGRLIKEEPAGEKNDEETKTLRHLDERMFETPAFALETAVAEVVHMGEVTLANLERAVQVLRSRDEQDTGKVFEVENTVDQMEKLLTGLPHPGGQPLPERAPEAGGGQPVLPA